MRIRVRAFGVTVLSFTVDSGPLLELLDEDETYQDNVDPHSITGGSAMNFERDGNPIAANHEEPWYSDGHFGFH